MGEVGKVGEVGRWVGEVSGLTYRRVVWVASTELSDVVRGHVSYYLQNLFFGVGGLSGWVE